MNQLELFNLDSLETLIPVEQKGKSIEEAWLEFHELNPHIGRRLRQMALNLKETGVQRYGIKALWEVLRYQYVVQTWGDNSYKLNNNFTAYYARWIMDTTVSLEGFFETRERRG